MVNSELYCQQLDRVQEQLRRGTSGWKRRTTPLLLHDNARPHVARLTQQKIVELGWEVLTHPAYLPDCAPSDYHLFRSLEHSLRGVRFADQGEVKKHLDGFFGVKHLDFFERGIGLLTEKWQKIVDNNGSYFE